MAWHLALPHALHPEGNKAISRSANHTWGALVLQLLEGQPSIFSSILNTLMRNPWLSSAMPTWEDSRSDVNDHIEYEGWTPASSRQFSDEEPLHHFPILQGLSLW